jgi:uncharacterized protein YndB with AHSA1/START domain
LRPSPNESSSHHVYEHHPPSSNHPCWTREDLSGVPGCGCESEISPAERIHRQGAPPRGESRRQLQKTSFTNFTTGASHSFGGEYVELTPHERIRYTDKFDDPNLPGEMQTTIDLKKVECGTELSIVQEGVPAVIPASGCYLGWQESLILLAKLVEAEIPG